MAVVICVIIVSFLKTQIILSSLALGTPFQAFDCSKADYSIKSHDMGHMKLNTIDVVVYECKIKVSTHSQYCG